MSLHESAYWEMYVNYTRVADEAKVVRHSLQGLIMGADLLPATGNFPGTEVAESTREAVQKMRVVSDLIEDAMSSLTKIIKAEDERKIWHRH